MITSRIVGTVDSVDAIRNGSVLVQDAAVGASVLYVESVLDFDGAALTLGEEPLTYIAVNEDAQSITLSAPLEVGAVTDDPVWTLDGSGSVEVEWVCYVDTGEGEPIPCEIPTSLLPYFPEGLATQGLTVEIGLVVGPTTDGAVDATSEWQVLTRPSQDSQFQASVRVPTLEGGNAGGLDDSGNLSSQDFTPQGYVSIQADKTLIDDNPIGAILAALPRGMHAYGERVPSVTNVGNSFYGILQMEFEMPVPRAARIRWAFESESSVAACRINATMRRAYSATNPVTANGSTPQEMLWALVNPGAAGSNIDFERSYVVELPAGYHSLRFEVRTVTTGATTSLNTSTAGLPPRPVRVEVEDIGATSDPTSLTFLLNTIGLVNLGYKPPDPGVLATGGADTGSTAPPARRSYTREYAATATNWWEGDNTYRQSDNQYVGYLGGEGNRKSAIWFNDAKIRADLAGATVTGARLRINVWDGGRDKTIVVGSHDDSTVRTAYGSITGKNADRTRKAGVNEGSSPWINLPFNLQGWATGAIRGLLIGPGPNNDFEYRFSYRGNGHPNEPVLELTYER